MKEAMHWERLNKEGDVHCKLCAHNCRIKPGNTGICRVRENRKGKLYSLIYGRATSLGPDPIEKKPLFHFHPGTRVLSYGTIGCNFRCDHCQNYTISQAGPNSLRLHTVKAEDIPKQVKSHNCQGVGWTYNEPSIWYEFTLDGSKIAKKHGYYTCYVTNGFIQEDPLRELAPYLDGMNVDIKAFKNDFYKSVCSSRLQPVLDTCLLAKELDIHLEVTYLIIPGYNDSKEELDEFGKWVLENLGDKLPLHFSAFHPDYKMRHVERTSMEKMMLAYRTAKEIGLKFVYLGNIISEYENTVCPKCGMLNIERHGFGLRTMNLIKDRCGSCGEDLNIRR